MPRGVEDSLQHYTELWNTRGVRAWEEEWWMLARAGRRRDWRAVQCARRVGGLPAERHQLPGDGGVVPRLQRPPQQGGLHRSEFPFGHVLLGGATLARRARRDGAATTTPFTSTPSACSTPSTKRRCIVPISHVIFRSAFIQDVEAIVEKAHRVGAYVLLDSFQATGTLPFDVQKLNVDFCTGGVLKWLCGGPGTGVSLRASGPGEEAGADLHRLDRPRKSLWLRDRPHSLRADDLSLHPGHAEHSRRSRWRSRV